MFNANAYVYMLASRQNGTLYTGVANDLVARVFQHRSGVGSKFVMRYAVHRLVWFEGHDLYAAAVTREVRIKRWRRAWKIALIEAENKDWRDLYPEIAQP